MSAAEIMKELPKLTDAERREVHRKLAELKADEDMQLCNQAPRETSRALDRQEEVACRARLNTCFAE